MGPITRAAAAALLAAGLALPALAEDSGAAQPSASWEEIREQLWPGADVAEGGEIISLDTPYRAHDAAVVPVGISIDPPQGRRVTGMTLIVEENPAPVAAEFEFGQGMGERVTLSTRVRVEAYSNIRVVAELDDGSLHHFARYVKASGGCAAPAVKDQDAAMAVLGQMKLRRFEAGQAMPGMVEAQVMVRHPNNSGFQMDQVTRHYIPAFFVDEIAVTQAGELVFRATGGISLSEDPTIRFSYRPMGEAPLELYAHDTNGGEYRQSFPSTGS